VITSHGPSRESCTPAQESSGWPAKASGTSAAELSVSAKRVRAALSTEAGIPALLQHGMPGGGTEMVAPESPGEIPGDGSGPTETERPKPPLP